MLLKTHSFEFGEFCLETNENILLRQGKPVSLTPKAFQLLMVLVENHGKIVEKEDLMRTVWVNSFVEDSNLTFTVSLLRKVLNDDRQNPRFIETVPKRGYRFIAEVRSVNSESEQKKLKEKIKQEGNDDDDSLLYFSASSHTAFPSSLSPSPPSHKASVVALTEWQQRETVKDAAEKKSASATAPQNLNGQVAKVELVSAKAGGGRKRDYRFLVLAGLIFAFVSISIGYAAYRFLGGKKTTSLSKSGITRLTSNGKTKSAAVSPDGRFVAYVLDDEGRESLWLKTVSAGKEVQILPSTEGVSLQGVTFAPDGTHIYYAAKGTLYQLPILGGLPKKVLENFGMGPITFSPDRKKFAFIRHSTEIESSIIITEADGSGEERVLASSKAPEKFLRSAAWSPDGKTITATTRDADGGNKIVAVRVMDGYVSAVPSPVWGIIWEAVWRPEGDSLFVVATEGRSSISAQIWRLSYPGGEAENVSNDLSNYKSLSLTADSDTMVLVREQQTAHIWTMLNGEDANRAKQLTHGLDGYDGIWGLNFLSPGDKIIYGNEPRDGDGEVWAIDAASGERTPITDKGGAAGISPDGKYLVFQGRDDNDKNSGLFRLNLSNGEEKRLTNGADIWATFSPDGKWIVFTRFAEQVALWKVSVDGGREVKLTNVPGAPLAPSVSPDGKLIAFYWRKEKREQPSEIALMPLDGGEITKSFVVSHGRFFQNYGKDALQWTPDGQTVNFISHRDGVSNIWRQPIDGNAPVQITDFASGQIFNFAFSPDGNRLALSRGTYSRDVILINNKE